MTDPIEIRGRKPEDELPESLRPYFKGYRRATATPDIGGLRARLEGTGFFVPRVPRSRSRVYPLLRAAGLILVFIGAFWLLQALRGPSQVLYAEVERVSGALHVDRGGRPRVE